MAAAEVRLKSPLPCWHESLASARTDPLVSLSVDGGHIQTNRPLPAGTPVFLELSLGQSLGSEKTEIDAVAEAAKNGTPGFFVRFLRMDERARAWIEERVRQTQAEAAPPPLEAPPKAPALEPPAVEPPAVERPAFEVPVIAAAAVGAAAIAASALDEPTREPAIAGLELDEPTREPAIAGLELDEPTREPAIALDAPAADPFAERAEESALDAPAADPFAERAAASALDEPTREPALAFADEGVEEAFGDAAPAAAPVALADAVTDDVTDGITRGLTGEVASELAGGLTSDAVDAFDAPFDDVTAPLLPAPGPEEPAPAPDPFGALEIAAAPLVAAGADDIESTQRWAIPPPSAPRALTPPAAIAAPLPIPPHTAPTPPPSMLPAAFPVPLAPAAVPELGAPPPTPAPEPPSSLPSVAPPRTLSPELSLDETQPWARASFDSIPPRPLPAPDASPDDIDSTRPWARAALTSSPPIPAAPIAEPPPPPAPEPTPRAPLPRTPTPTILNLNAPPATSPNPLSAPLPRMTQLDVPGEIPAAQSFNETMRWPVAQVRVAQAPLEMPVSAPEPAPPPDIEEPAAEERLLEDPGLDAMFEPDAPPSDSPAPSVARFDAPAEVTDAPRLQTAPPQAAPPEAAPPQSTADGPFGASGGFLGAEDDEIPAGGNGAFDFGLEVTDPGARSDESAPPAATLEDSVPPYAPDGRAADFGAGLVPDIGGEAGEDAGAADAGFSLDLSPGPAHDAAIDAAIDATDEGALPSDVDELEDAATDAEPMELVDAELEELKDVLGGAVVSPPQAVVPEAAPAVASNPFQAARAPSNPFEVARAPSTNPFAAIGAAPQAAPVPRSATPRPQVTQPFFATADVAAALSAPTLPSPVLATRTTDPLFPAYTDPVPAPDASSAPPIASSFGSAPLGTPPPMTAPTAMPAPLPSAAPPPLPPRTAPPTLMFAAADVNAAVAAARPPAIASAAMLTNEAPVAPEPSAGVLPAALAAQLPGDAEFELAFQMAEPPARSAAHEPAAWAVQASAPAPEEDLPLVVGDTELPVIMGTPKTQENVVGGAPESWVVPKKPGA